MPHVVTRALLALSLVALSVPALRAQDAPAAKAAMSASAPVNLNTATVAQLEALPGVGQRVAERIVEYRTKNGGFKKLEDLMNVQGIGEKSFLKLKPMLTIGPPKQDAKGGDR
jgi:competence protein ComEA